MLPLAPALFALTLWCLAWHLDRECGVYRFVSSLSVLLRSLGIAGLLAVTACVVSAQRGGGEAKNRASRSDGGLALRLMRVGGNGSGQRFRLELQNTTTQGMVVEIGTMQGDGRFQYLDAFRYMLQTPDGRVVELTVGEPASLFGSPTPELLRVPLGPDAVLSLPVNFAEMRLQGIGDWRVRLRPGTYAFWVEYRHEMTATGVRGPGVLPQPLVPYWVGATRTETLRFAVE